MLCHILILTLWTKINGQVNKEETKVIVSHLGWLLQFTLDFLQLGQVSILVTAVALRPVEDAVRLLWGHILDKRNVYKRQGQWVWNTQLQSVGVIRENILPYYIRIEESPAVPVGKPDHNQLSRNANVVHNCWITENLQNCQYMGAQLTFHLYSTPMTYNISSFIFDKQGHFFGGMLQPRCHDTARER